MDTSTKDRILLFIKSLGYSQKKFEEEAKLSNGYINNLKASPTADKLQKILYAFPQLNSTWLLTGMGEMLNEDKPAEKTEGRLIPVYDATIGGNNSLVAPADCTVVPSNYINTGSWFPSATAAIRHYGDSMVEYPSGCVLAVKEVLDRDLIIPGHNYVIETTEYRVTKRLQFGKEEGYITAYSSNLETYPDGHLINEPFNIKKTSIRRLFLVLGYVTQETGEVIMNE